MIKRKAYAFKDTNGNEVSYSDRYEAEHMANGAEIYEIEVWEPTTKEMIHDMVYSASREELVAIAGNMAPKEWRVKKPEKLPTVKELLKANDMTQRELCERFGIPKRTVEDWSRGVRVCPSYVIRMMQELLNQ